MNSIAKILSSSPYPMTANAIAHRIGNDFVSEEYVQRVADKMIAEGTLVECGENLSGQMMFALKQKETTE